MIIHYFKIAWRNILKYKVSAGIGIIGLAVGLLCFVLCCYCARLIMGADQDFPGYKRIAEISLTNEGDYFSGTPAHTIAALGNNFAGSVECFTSVTYAAELNVSFEQKDGRSSVFVINTLEVDPHFKDVFSCRLVAGNWERIFRQKNAVVLSRSMAAKVYGKENPLGKLFHPNEFSFRSPEREYTPEELAAIDYIVMGVMEDLPLNASFSFLKPVHALLYNDEYGVLQNQKPGDGRTMCNTYALLRPGVSLPELNRLVDVKKHGVMLGSLVWTPEFSPIGEEYMKRFHGFGNIFLGIGTLILLVSLLNFFTFLAGNFFNRLREYNIRKGVGANRKQLFGLLFSENLLYIVPVAVLVFCLLELLHEHLDFSIGNRALLFSVRILFLQLLQYLAWGIVLCGMICWLISVHLNRKYIGGGLRNPERQPKNWVRNGMLGLQLIICCLFLVGSLALYQQSRKIDNTLFASLSAEEKENILEVQLDYPQLKNKETFLIESFSRFPEVVGRMEADQQLMSWENGGMGVRGNEYIEYRIIKVSPNFTSFLKMPLLEGQVFQCPGQAVIDPRIARWIGGDPLNKVLDNGNRGKFEVCGLTEALPEIYTEGRNIAVLWTKSEHPVYSYLKVQPGTGKVVRKKVKDLLTGMLPESVQINIHTLQEVIDKQDRFNNQMKPVFLFFTIVCILITILGVYSAISIDTRRRQKEVAIRKINGAPAWNIIGLFVRLYIRLLAVTVLLCFPVLWWGIKMWLADYTVHFYYGLWFWLGILGFLVLIIAVTIVWKIREIISLNPVGILRSE